MQVIDLSLPLYSGMPVFPGDPEVRIELIQNFAETGWNMRRLELNAHDGTHINVPIHGMAEGKTLDDFELESFMGECNLYASDTDIRAGVGIIFNRDITWDDAHKIAENKPRFVGSWATNDIDVEIEKYFFEVDILLYERLTNLDKLPKSFYFHGVPLKIRAGDGSPVRAYAIVN